jgi:hypothetical protein
MESMATTDIATFSAAMEPVRRAVPGPIPPRAARSPAQRAASRRNGTRSGGPRTLAGKAISSRNALRHGLLARALAPPADARGDHKLYWDIHAELLEEFHPNTFTGRSQVAQLAATYVQLVRARHYLHEIQRVRLTPQHEMVWQRDHQHHEQLELLSQWRQDCAAGQMPRCDAERAAWLERKVQDLLADLRERVAEYAAALHQAPNAAPADAGTADAELDALLDADDRRQLREVQQMLEAGERFAAGGALRGVLTGHTRPQPDDPARLGILLGELQWRIERAVERDAPVIDALAQHSAVPRPDFLQHTELAQRYISRLERSIERTARQLRE